MNNQYGIQLFAAADGRKAREPLDGRKAREPLPDEKCSVWESKRCPVAPALSY
ncbi:hypothetical protein [Aminivibrio sp.]|uniref:hypothetical protein n=1 Tax=Aminivibrio sp. TaxID=1872489 RepID=UPI003D972800